MSVCVESTITQANSVDCHLNKRNGRRGAICQEGSVSFFNRFFLMLNDRISLLSNRGIRAPRILNYMNSLNVSIEYPLSPFNDEPSRGLIEFSNFYWDFIKNGPKIDEIFPAKNFLNSLYVVKPF